MTDEAGRLQFARIGGGALPDPAECTTKRERLVDMANRGPREESERLGFLRTLEQPFRDPGIDPDENSQHDGE